MLLVQGTRVSPALKELLSDLARLKGSEQTARLTRKNDAHPFEASSEPFFESHARRTDSALLAFASHSKKRPDNVVLGRFYDGGVYDLLELGVQNYRGIGAFAGSKHAALGTKPAILFVGDAFEQDEELARAKEMLLDLFRGDEVKSLNVAGLDRALVVAAEPLSADPGAPKALQIRSYAVRLKKASSAKAAAEANAQAGGGDATVAPAAGAPRALLEPAGPQARLVLRRSRAPPAALVKEALKQPKLARKKDKNERTDAIDGRVAKVYVPRQNVEELALFKPKGVKRQRREDAKEKADAKKGKQNDQ